MNNDIKAFVMTGERVMCSPPNTYGVGGVGNLNYGAKKKKKS